MMAAFPHCSADCFVGESCLWLPTSHADMVFAAESFPPSSSSSSRACCHVPLALSLEKHRTPLQPYLLTPGPFSLQCSDHLCIENILKAPQALHNVILSIAVLDLRSDARCRSHGA